MTRRKKKDLSQNVMKQIHKGQVKMRPRIYFVVGSLLLGVGMAGATISAIGFAAVTLFRLRMHHPEGFLRFGRLGVRPFLSTFPFVFVALAIVAVWGGLALLKRYDIAYRRSFWVLALGLIAFVVTVGFVLDRVGANERLEKFSQLGPLYHHRFVDREFVIGTVVEADDDSVIVVTPVGEEVRVVIGDRTRLPSGGEFEMGDMIHAVGMKRDGEFEAHGIVRGDFGRMSRGGGLKGKGNFGSPKRFSQ